MKELQRDGNRQIMKKKVRNLGTEIPYKLSHSLRISSVYLSAPHVGKVKNK